MNRPATTVLEAICLETTIFNPDSDDHDLTGASLLLNLILPIHSCRFSDPDLMLMR